MAPHSRKIQTACKKVAALGSVVGLALALVTVGGAAAEAVPASAPSGHAAAAKSSEPAKTTAAKPAAAKPSKTKTTHSAAPKPKKTTKKDEKPKQEPKTKAPKTKAPKTKAQEKPKGPERRAEPTKTNTTTPVKTTEAADPSESADQPTVAVEKSELPVQEMTTTGVVVTGSGFQANERIVVRLDNETGAGSAIHSSVDGTLSYTHVNPAAEVGDHSIQFRYGAGTDDTGVVSVDYAVTPDATSTTTTSAPATTTTSAPATTSTSSAPATTSTSSAPATTTSAPAKAKLTIDPKKISAKKFVSEKGGVRLAVSGLKPGTSVTFKVQPKFGHVTPYTLTVTANSKGVAQWSVYGTNPANPSVYVGKYAVTAKVAGGKTFTGSFRVTSGNPNAGGGNGSGGGSGGYDYGDGGSGGGWLPRTGIELTSAGAGAVLLLVGGAVVFLTRRRKG